MGDGAHERAAEEILRGATAGKSVETLQSLYVKAALERAALTVRLRTIRRDVFVFGFVAGLLVSVLFRYL